MYDFDINKDYVLFLKPSYDNHNKVISYTGKIQDYNEKKLKLIDKKNITRYIDLDSIFEIREARVGYYEGKKE